MMHLPLRVMISAACVMQYQAAITGLPPAITPSFVKKYLNHWAVSSDKAITELGYRITPFKVGIKRTLEWYENSQ